MTQKLKPQITRNLRLELVGEGVSVGTQLTPDEALGLAAMLIWSTRELTYVPQPCVQTERKAAT